MEEISDNQWDSGKYKGAADDDWENCVRSQDTYFEEDWGVIVLYTMYLVSSSVNISTFHITWLDTYGQTLYFWVPVFSSFRYIPKAGISGLYGYSKFGFWGTATIEKILKFLSIDSD